MEYGAGVREIEVGSFVPEELLPQMADTADVVRGARSHTDLVVAVLVPNLRGCEAPLRLAPTNLHTLVTERNTQPKERTS